MRGESKGYTLTYKVATRDHVKKKTSFFGTYLRLVEKVRNASY